MTAWRVQKHRLAAVPAELVAHDHASVSTAGLTSNVVFSRPVLATRSFPGPQSSMPLAVPSSLLLWPRTVEVVPVQVRQPSCRAMTARLPVTVSSVQTWFYMYAYVKKSSPGSTQLPTTRRSGPHTKCIEPVTVTGMGVSSLFRSPATLDRNNYVSVAPTNFLFYYKKPEVESF